MGASWPKLTPEDDEAIRLLWCNKLSQYFWDATSKGSFRKICTELERYQAQQFLLHSGKPLDEICHAGKVDPDFVRTMAEGLSAKDWLRPFDWTERSSLGETLFQINENQILDDLAQQVDDSNPGAGDALADGTGDGWRSHEHRQPIANGSMATAVRHE